MATTSWSSPANDWPFTSAASCRMRSNFSSTVRGSFMGSILLPGRRARRLGRAETPRHPGAESGARVGRGVVGGVPFRPDGESYQPGGQPLAELADRRTLGGQIGPAGKRQGQPADEALGLARDDRLVGHVLL